MAIETQLLLSAAEKLNAQWKKRLTGENQKLLPHELELAAGILNLAQRQAPLRKLLEKANNPTAEVLDTVKQHVEEFQNEISVLRTDGILGTKTLSELTTSFGCHHKPPNTRQALGQQFRSQDPQGRDTNELWFFYHIESTPDLHDAKTLIRRAWDSWKKVALVRAWEVPKERANVIIRATYIDGGGPILGEAHVGPPTGFVLELNMDLGHSWNPTRFQGAVCHEIGHIIGLDDHTPGDGHLMSAYIREGTIEPSPEDIKRARQLPHLGPPPDRPDGPQPLPPDPNDSQLLQDLAELLARRNRAPA